MSLSAPTGNHDRADIVSARAAWGPAPRRGGRGARGAAPLNLFWQDLVNGLLAGGIFAVVALGFSLVWGIMNIINLAHGALIMLGAYTSYVLFTAFHIDPFVSIPISFAVLFVFGYCVQRFVINFVVRAPILTTFLLTFGLSLLIVNVALLIFHGRHQGHRNLIQRLKFFARSGDGRLREALDAWSRRCSSPRSCTCSSRVSKTGRAIRAMAMDIDAAQLSGVRVAHLYAIVFGLGAGLAGAAGALISLSFGLQPSMGDPFVISAFVVCVLGGLGTVQGALVGGLVYGVLESFGSQYIGTGLQDAVALVVLLIVLIVRPNGILGKATA